MLNLKLERVRLHSVLPACCGSTAKVGPRPLHFGALQTLHRHTTHATGLLWTSDQLVGEAAACTTHNVHKGRAYMPSAGFEPAIPVIKQLQTYALERTVTGIGVMFIQPLL